MPNPSNIVVFVYNTLCVLMTVSSLQGTYAGLPDFLTQVVESELARIPRAFARYHPDQRWTIVYLPQAFHLTVMCVDLYQIWN